MKTIKVLYNGCIGGYSLSVAAVKELQHRYGWKSTTNRFESRHDPRIVALYEEKGSEWFSGENAKVEMVEIQADGYKINERYGKEDIVECHADFILV